MVAGAIVVVVGELEEVDVDVVVGGEIEERWRRMAS